MIHIPNFSDVKESKNEKNITMLKCFTLYSELMCTATEIHTGQFGHFVFTISHVAHMTLSCLPRLEHCMNIDVK